MALSFSHDPDGLSIAGDCPKGIHLHDGYNHAEGRPLTKTERRLLNHILKTWREYNEGK